MKICEIESVKKSIFEEIAKLDEQVSNLKSELVVEEGKCINITKTQVKFFLSQIKNGNIDDEYYKKLIINTLIDKVFLYDDSILIVFSVSDAPYNGKLPDINTLECSLMGEDALPFGCCSNFWSSIYIKRLILNKKSAFLILILIIR